MLILNSCLHINFSLRQQGIKSEEKVFYKLFLRFIFYIFFKIVNLTTLVQT